MNSRMWNPQPKIGSFIKLLLRMYLMHPSLPFRRARSHKYIQSTSVLWLAISKTRSFIGILSPEKTTLVLFIFSNRHGHIANQIPKTNDTAFLLKRMLISRNPTAASGARYTKQIKAVETNTTKHIRPLKNLNGVKGRSFNVLSDLRGLQTSIVFKELLKNLPSAIRYFNVICQFPKFWTSIFIIT